MTAAAQALLALAEAERALVADGAAARCEELVELVERRDELMAMLPSDLDDEDRAALLRALEIQADSMLQMVAMRDEIAAELKRLDLGRRTARGYAPAGMPAGGSLSLRG